MKNKIRLTVIGCGTMAQAIVDWLTKPVSCSAFKQNGDIFDITVTDKQEKKLFALRGKCKVSLDNAEATKLSDYVLVAVKPQDAESALCGLDLTDKVVISVMAGVTVERIKALTKSNKVMRVMPNINARVGESMSVYCCDGLSDENKRVAIEILGSFGQFDEIDESLMNAATGIVGSGPAFILMTIKAFCDEAISRGFTEKQAKDLAVQVFIGTALTAEESDWNFDALISSVCSPGGTTIEGVSYLNDKDYNKIIRAAISKAVSRSEELSK
ncbi:MAG: pyrroline-5-carboxylate reductase [Clostridiales bacterium]|nr:pyrroline-5-carboxylate reductase [Clostridiales bacterium]